MTDKPPAGVYGDDSRRYHLPDDWKPVRPEVRDTALQQALRALSSTSTPERVRDYYDPGGDFTGTTFLDVGPNPVHDISAADLWAVGALSVPVHPRQGRLLLDPASPAGSRVRAHLHAIGDEFRFPLTDLEHADGGSAALLTAMWNLHHDLKTLLDESSNRWVFAAKLCARKRPWLFPVRDDVVCRYLGAVNELRPRDGRPGDFGVDLQVFAYLITHPDVTRPLDALRHDLETDGLRVDEPDLKLLDAVLWTFARVAG